MSTAADTVYNRSPTWLLSPFFKTTHSTVTEAVMTGIYQPFTQKPNISHQDFYFEATEKEALSSSKVKVVQNQILKLHLLVLIERILNLHNVI